MLYTLLHCFLCILKGLGLTLSASQFLQQLKQFIMQAKTKYLCVFLLFAVNFTALTAQAGTSYTDYLTMLRLTAPYLTKDMRQEVKQNNEFLRTSNGEGTNFHDNPLLLNGKSLDYSAFDLNSKGVLSVVQGDPESKDAKPIPFYVSIRRNGDIISDKKMPFLNKVLYKIELSDIFLFSKPGDRLIINPVRSEDWKAKRILKLLGTGGC